MPFQHADFTTIELELTGRKAIACAETPFETADPSRRRPWMTTRFGFAGSAEGFDLLRFETPTLALTPENAPGILAAGLIDLLVVEGAIDDLVEDWDLSFLDWSSAGEGARTLMRQAAEVGIPRLALLRAGRGAVPLFAPLAAEADLVAVTDRGAQEALAGQGIPAEPVGLAVQPALYNAFAPLEDCEGGERGVLSLDLDRALADPEAAETLAGLVPFGIEICAPDAVLQRHRVAKLEALRGHCLGTVTPSQLRHLLKTRDMVVQIAAPGRDAARDVQHALHAAACRCAVAVLGEIPADDPRRGFAHVFETASDLRAFVSRFAMDRVWAEKQMQVSWRRVHREHAAAPLAARLATLAGHAAEPRSLAATVVTPTYRPELLASVLATFRAQTWSEKELIVVANTDCPEEWQTDLIDPAAGEQLVFLPDRFGPGTALNIGAGRGKGDYVMRMDDDDEYGSGYIEDMMLSADALLPDILGKKVCFYHYVDEAKLVWGPLLRRRPSWYSSDDLPGQRGGHIAGFTHTVRRELFATLHYPHHFQGAADTGFLDDAWLSGDLLCACTDGLNAVVERRADVHSHTWQHAPAATEPAHADVPMSLEALLE